MRQRDRNTWIVTIAALVVAVFAIGGAHRWSVVALGLLSAGALSLQITSQRQLGRPSPLLVLLAAAVALTALQLVPLPALVMEILHPAAYDLIADGSRLAGSGEPVLLPLSLDPPGTLFELVKLCSYLALGYVAVRMAVSERGRIRILTAVGARHRRGGGDRPHPQAARGPHALRPVPAALRLRRVPRAAAQPQPLRLAAGGRHAGVGRAGPARSRADGASAGVGGGRAALPGRVAAHPVARRRDRAGPGPGRVRGAAPPAALAGGGLAQEPPPRSGQGDLPGGHRGPVRAHPGRLLQRRRRERAADGDQRQRGDRAAQQVHGLEVGRHADRGEPVDRRGARRLRVGLHARAPEQRLSDLQPPGERISTGSGGLGSARGAGAGAGPGLDCDGAVPAVERRPAGRGRHRRAGHGGGAQRGRLRPGAARPGGADGAGAGHADPRAGGGGAAAPGQGAPAARRRGGWR